MATMSKTAALKAASNAVGRPMGGRTNWCFFAPYYRDQLNGASTEVRASSYAEIVTRRTERVVSTAVALMGIKGDVFLDGATGNARDLLDMVLEDQNRYIIRGN